MTVKRTWQLVGLYGWRCGDYSIGKVYVDGCTLYETWYRQELIASTDNLDDARAAARAHDRTVLAGAV